MSAANAANVEHRIAVALALDGRGNAYAELRPRASSAHARCRFWPPPSATTPSLVVITRSLKDKGVIHGTDLQTLDDAQRELSGFVRTGRGRRCRGADPAVKEGAALSRAGGP